MVRVFALAFLALYAPLEGGGVMRDERRAARAEARHDAVVGWCETQRDKALLPSTKAIWQAIIDKLEEP